MTTDTNQSDLSGGATDCAPAPAADVLPEPAGLVYFEGGQYEQGWVSSQDAYTADQLRAAIAAERARTADTHAAYCHSQQQFHDAVAELSTLRQHLAEAHAAQPVPAPAVDERIADSDSVDLAAASNGSPGGAASWRCFHCDELFTDRQEAQDHFGESEHDRPFCQMDANYIRWLLAQHRRNVDDDSEALRTVRSLAGQHEALRRRAEELGYARGLADAKRHPEELGLVAARSAATSPEADGQMKKD